jgi:enoyl-CoA hydratase
MLTANRDLQVLLAQVDEGRRLFRTFAYFPKPLIAALHGHVIGVATSLALTADAVVSTAGVRISDRTCTSGWWPGTAGASPGRRAFRSSGPSATCSGVSRSWRRTRTGSAW